MLPGDWESRAQGSMLDAIQDEPLGIAEISVRLAPSAATVGQVETLAGLPEFR